MRSRHNSRGKEAEKIALQYLIKQKMQLIYQNYHSRYGEIDLIMNTNNIIIFVEVRYRQDANLLDPLETIDSYKQRKIIITGQKFLQEHASHYPEHDYRFDVITIMGALKKAKINWIQNAFSA